METCGAVKVVAAKRGLFAAAMRAVSTEAAMEWGSVAGWAAVWEVGGGSARGVASAAGAPFLVAAG